MLAKATKSMRPSTLGKDRLLRRTPFLWHSRRRRGLSLGQTEGSFCIDLKACSCLDRFDFSKMKPCPSNALFLLRWSKGKSGWNPVLSFIFAAVLLAFPIEILKAQQSPPVIQTPPRDQSVFAGGPASFFVTASGTAPLQYQWFGPSAFLPNSTAATLFLPQVDLSDAGSYYVKVSNSAGTTTSTSAVLTVVRADFGDAPSPYPTLLSADGARHRVVPGIYLGSQITFEPNGQPDPAANGDPGDDGISFITVPVRGQPCTIKVTASVNGFLDGWIDYNGNGSWSEATDQVFSSVPLSAGANFLTFNVPTSATLGNTYARFRFSTQGGLRFTGLAPDGEVEDYILKIFAAAADLAVTAVAQPNAVPPNTVGHCLLTVSNLGPNIASNVLATNFLAGVTILSLQGDGNCSVQPDMIICNLGNIPPSTSRKIFFDFSPLQQAVLNDTFVARSDTFDPIVANNRTGFVIRAAQPLVILKQPQGQRVLPGSDISFFVDAQGVGALTYQWFMNGAALAGETAQSLTLFSVQNSASIQVQVSDAYSSVMSAVAALLVVSPAQITVQPNPVFVSHGNSAAFSVQVDGTSPFRFQWRLNGANIKGATNPVYVVDRVSKTNAGTYTVAVANDAGVTSSRPVPLICTDIITLDPADNFGNAIQIPPPGVSPFQGEVQTSSANATTESGEPTHAQKEGGASVWFKWIAPSGGTVAFDTIGSSFDTLLAVYTGTEFGNLVEVSSDDDRGGYFTSVARFNITAGKTYLLAVDGLAGKRGNVVLGWTVDQRNLALPVIAVQPKNVTALESNSVALSVQVLGGAGANFLYQWIFEGEPLPGATSSTLTIPSLTPRKVGNYSVLIRDANSDLTLESQQATVEIGPFPYIQSQDKVEDVLLNTPSGAGGAGFAQTKSGGSGGFPPFISVAFGIPGTQVMNNTNSTADIDCFDIGSASRWLGILTTNAPPGSLLRIDSSGSAIPTEMAIYRFLDLACLQNTNCYSTNLLACDTNSSGGGAYSLLQVTPRTGGQYLVFADGLSGAEGFIRMNWQLGIPPVIIPALSNCFLVCAAGTNISLACGVTNASPVPSYQWFREGTPLASETNSTLSFLPIQSSNAASYSVIVSNIFGVVTNTCCVFVNPPLLRSQIAYSRGTPITFSISSMLLPDFVLQVATNLNLPIQWGNLFTNSTTNCSFLYVAPMLDTNGILYPQRYYRLRKP
jgi:hypothetical protein